MKKVQIRYIFFHCVQEKVFDMVMREVTKIHCTRRCIAERLPAAAEWENWIWMLEIADNVESCIII